MIPTLVARFWAWYRRVGQPLVFETALSKEVCMQRINAASTPWDSWNPLARQRYQSLILYDGRFKVRKRGLGAAERPFEGKLESLPSGGTRVSGQVLYDTSFLGFVGVLVVAAPLLGALVYGRWGLLVGLLVGVIFLFSAFFARLAEESSQNPAAVAQWLMQTLDAKPKIIEAQHRPRRLR